MHSIVSLEIYPFLLDVCVKFLQLLYFRTGVFGVASLVEDWTRCEDAILCPHTGLHLLEMRLHDEFELYPHLSFLLSVQPGFFQQLNTPLKVSDIGDGILELNILEGHKLGQ